MRDRDDDTGPNPNGCRWCGIDPEEHVRLWAPTVNWHLWVEPTDAQRKKRILDRRARRRHPPEGLLAS